MPDCKIIYNQAFFLKLSFKNYNSIGTYMVYIKFKCY